MSVKITIHRDYRLECRLVFRSFVNTFFRRVRTGREVLKEAIGDTIDIILSALTIKSAGLVPDV